MIIYLLTLGITFLLAYYAQTKQKVLEDGVIKKTSKHGKWAIAAICAILILLGGLRVNVGADFGIYWTFFIRDMDKPFFDVLGTDEGAFWSIASFIGLFTKDEQVVFLVCQAIIVICIVPTLAKYSHNLSLTVFLYLAMFDYFSSLNGVRQWVAAAIIFAALPYLKERKLIRYFLLCVFAYFFHNSAILMIPIGLFVLTSPVSKWNVIALTVLGLLFFLMPSVLDSLIGWAVDDKYTQFVDGDTSEGVNVLRIAVAAAPMLVARLFYRRLYEGEEDKRFLDLLINFSTVNFVVYMLATRGTTMARISMYTSLYNALLIPYFLRIFKKESRLTAKLLLMALFGLYMIMILPVDSQLLPYQNSFGWYFA